MVKPADLQAKRVNLLVWFLMWLLVEGRRIGGEGERKVGEEEGRRRRGGEEVEPNSAPPKPAFSHAFLLLAPALNILQMGGKCHLSRQHVKMRSFFSTAPLGMVGRIFRPPWLCC